MPQRLFLFLVLVCLGLGASLRAATFDLRAGVDRTEVELGESVIYTLVLQVNGRMDFPVQIAPPKFEGFQPSQPQRSDQSSWINGAVTEQHSFTWELIPIKAGTVAIPAVTANAKDALNGEVNKNTAAISIRVRRPKNAYSASAALPPGRVPGPGLTPLQQEEQTTPPPDDSGLRDIKPDIGLPWLRLGMLLGAFGAVMALLVGWARRPTPPVEEFVVVRDPRATAFSLLDAALLRLAAGDERAFVLEAGRALRGYLRQRLELRQETTLAEAMKACKRPLADAAERERADALRSRLEVLLYGDGKYVDSDRILLDHGSRRLIDTLERLAGR